MLETKLMRELTVYSLFVASLFYFFYLHFNVNLAL